LNKAYFCFEFQTSFKKMDNQLTPFEGEKIRKIWHNETWFFSVVDIIGVLTESPDPKNYWSKLKERDPQTLTVCQSLKMLAADHKMRKTDCASTEGVFRIIMSIPSQKAEPLKLWLAEQGGRSINEAEDPELLTERQAELYRAKGYSEEWIGRRVQTIETRKALTDEWKQRGVKENQEYSILTAEIAKGTFGVTPSEHSKLKGLQRQNLRDHMTPLELIFTALGEEITRSETVKENAQGFIENREMAIKGGQLAGEARALIEKRRGEKVVSTDNFLGLGADKDAPKTLPEDKTD
jgi:DNA-damage-inducible protein D